jgi:hypothetical protein
VALPRSETAHHSRLSRYSPLAAIAFGIGGTDQGAQYRPQHNPLHLHQKRRPPCCPGVALYLTVANVSCLINPTRPRFVVLQCIIIRLLDTDLCRGSATARIAGNVGRLSGQLPSGISLVVAPSINLLWCRGYQGAVHASVFQTELHADLCGRLPDLGHCVLVSMTSAAAHPALD